MKKIKITLVKSPIDRPKKAKATIEALGLKKMHNSVEKDLTPQIQGMVNRVAHLINVENA